MKESDSGLTQKVVLSPKGICLLLFCFYNCVDMKKNLCGSVEYVDLVYPILVGIFENCISDLDISCDQNRFVVQLFGCIT